MSKDSEIAELRQALTEQHNRHVAALRDADMLGYKRGFQEAQAMLKHAPAPWRPQSSWRAQSSWERNCDAWAATAGFWRRYPNNLAATTRVPAHLTNLPDCTKSQTGCPSCLGNGSIEGQACPFCTHPLSPAGLASIGWIESATTLHAPDEDEEYHALGLTLLTDEQAAMTAERIEESHRLSCLADIFSKVPGL